MNEEALIKGSFNWYSIFTSGGPVGIIVFGILIFVSIFTWYVVFERWKTLYKLQKKSEAFVKIFWDAKSLSELYSKTKELEYSSAREIFKTGYNEIVRIIQMREKKNIIGGNMPFDTVRRSLIKARSLEEGLMLKNMSFLAISASACPFIGLFGTVIGIIRAFHDIGASGSSSLAAVAPGISEALAATALGLAAAIPAVVFYNVFASKIRLHLLLLDGFMSDFLNILERHYNINKNPENISE